MTRLRFAISNAAILLFSAAALVFSAGLPPRADAAELLAVGRASCPYCKAWEIEVGAIYEKTPAGRAVRLRRIDIGGLTSSPYRFREPVLYTPTFVIIEDGVEAGRITGYSDEAMFWGMLDEILARLEPDRRAPRYSRY
jgi:hypothetical protein